MNRDSFIFYRSFYEAISDLDDVSKLEVYDAISNYSLNGITNDIKGVSSAMFKLIKPQIDANIKRYENGKKGGRPKTKTKPKQNQTKTKLKPNVNVNVNDNVNEIKEKEISKDIPKKKEKTKKNYADFVKLTIDEYDRLINDYGKEKILEMIDRLNNYLNSNQKKKYQSHNLVIRNWIKKDETKNNLIKTQSNNISLVNQIEVFAKDITEKYSKLYDYENWERYFNQQVITFTEEKSKIKLIRDFCTNYGKTNKYDLHKLKQSFEKQLKLVGDD